MNFANFSLGKRVLWSNANSDKVDCEYILTFLTSISTLTVKPSFIVISGTIKSSFNNKSHKSFE